MKRSQIVLTTVFLVISGLMYISIMANKKEHKKSIKEESTTVYVAVTEVNNKQRTLPLASYGQISPITELMVSFEVQGKLMQGKTRLKPGAKFYENQILYQVDRQEQYFTIAARKMALSGMIAQAMPDIVLDFPNEKDKWEKFLFSLKYNDLLPVLPEFATVKERLFWTTRNMLTEYFNILALEKRLEKYAYIAPFSGTVIEVYAEPGSIVNPGVQVAKIARTGEFELRAPVPLKDLDNFKNQKSANFINSEGELVATGTIVRISDVINQRTQSADIYYSVKPVNNATVYNGMYLNVSIGVETRKNVMILPRTAVKDGKVMVFGNEKLISKEITIVGDKPDSVYVEGLQNGQLIVLEQVSATSDKIKFVPKQR